MSEVQEMGVFIVMLVVWLPVNYITQALLRRRRAGKHD
jgi:hypothetical protein